MDKNPVIVSLGVGGIFPKLLNRLKKSCKHFGIDYWLWYTYPLNAKTHSQSPYGFKIYVIQQALQKGFIFNKGNKGRESIRIAPAYIATIDDIDNIIDNLKPLVSDFTI